MDQNALTNIIVGVAVFNTEKEFGGGEGMVWVRKRKHNRFD